MTLNRMGNTNRAGKRSFGSPRAWITGSVAVGLVAATGAVASAAMQKDEAAPATDADQCLTLDPQTMRAIFEAWMGQGGGFRPGTMRPPAPLNPHFRANPSSKESDDDERSSDRDKRSSARYHAPGGGIQQPGSFWMGWQPAKVPMAALSVGACNEAPPGPGPTTPPTDVPIEPPAPAPEPPAPAPEPPAPAPAPTTQSPAPEPPAPAPEPPAPAPEPPAPAPAPTTQPPAPEPPAPAPVPTVTSTAS